MNENKPLKVINLGVRLTWRQREHLERKAEEASVTLSTLIRWRLLYDMPKGERR